MRTSVSGRVVPSGRRSFALAGLLALIGSAVLPSQQPARVLPGAGLGPVSAFDTVCPIAGIGPLADTAAPADGPALSARITGPTDLAVTTSLASTRVYVIEGPAGKRRIRALDTATSTVTTVAGSDAAVNLGASGVPATTVALADPKGLAVAPDGSALYVSEGGRLRQVDLATGIITTVGTGSASALTLIGGTLYWAEPNQGIVRALDLASGTQTPVIGGGAIAENDPTVSGRPGTELSLAAPNDVAKVVDADALTFTTVSGRVYRFDPASGVVTVVAGTYTGGDRSALADDGDGGPATAAHLGGYLTAVESAGVTYVASSFSNRLRAVTGGVIDEFAGARSLGWADSNPTSTRFALPSDVAVDGAGTVFVADTLNNRIRVLVGGQWTTIAGGGPPTMTVGNTSIPALAMGLPTLAGVARSSQAQAPTGDPLVGGETYITDPRAGIVYQIDAVGNLTRLAGTGAVRYSGEPFVDGEPALSHVFGSTTPDGLSLEALGPIRFQTIAGQRYLYLADGYGAGSSTRLVRIALDQPGRPVQLVAGTGNPGSPTLGAAATTTPMFFTDFDVAENGDVYVAPRLDPRVYRIDGQTGLVSSFAGAAVGNDYSISGIGGLAAVANVGLVSRIAVGSDSAGQFTVAWAASAPAGGSQLFRVGTDGVLRLFAGVGGNSDLSFPADGLTARVADVTSLAFDAHGRVISAEGAFLRATDVLTSASEQILFVAAPSTVVPTSATTNEDSGTARVAAVDVGSDGRVVYVDDVADPAPDIRKVAPFRGNDLVRELTPGGCAGVSAVNTSGVVDLSAGGAVDAATIPAANIPTSAIQAAASSALSGIDLRATAPVASPMRSIPMRSIPMRSITFPPIPLSSVPRADGESWADILAATTLQGVPVQNVTLQQVLDLADAGQLSPTLDLSLGSIDLSASVLNAASIASISLAGVPMRSIPLQDPPESDPFASWCSLLQGLGFSCSGLGLTSSSTLLEMELAGIPMRSIPMRSIPMRSIDLSASPMRSIPMRSILVVGSPMRSIPMRSIPMRSIDLSPSPMRSIPMRSIANAAAIVDCARVNCSTDPGNTATLGDAASLSPTAINDTASLGLLFDGLDDTTAGTFTLGDAGAYGDVTIGDLQPYLPITLTLADVLMTLIPRSELPWEAIPLDDLQLGQLGAGGTESVSGRFTVYSGKPTTSSLVITLPAGSTFRPGTMTIDGAPAADPVRQPDGRWKLSISLLSAGQHTFSMALAVTHLTASAPMVAVEDEITGTTTSVAVPVAAHAVIEGASPRPALAGGSLILGWLSGAPGEIDNFDVAVPSIPGATTTVVLSHLGADADLLGYNPTIRPPVSSRGFRDAGLQTPPAESTDPELAPAVPTIDPQTVQDLPVDATAPNGLAAVSAQRGTADERIEFVTKPGDSGFYRVSVAAYNGANTSEPYLITVRQQIPAGSGACPARPAPTAAPGPSSTAIAADRKTVFLLNEQRLRTEYGATAVDALMAKLVTLANRTEVAGTILRVDSDPAVRNAYTAWDATPCDAQRANDVVGAINTYVDQQLAASATRAQLASIVLVGSDQMVPMARLSDNTKVENESAYAGDVRDTSGGATPLSASLASRNLLTDDAYGDFDPIRWRDTALYVPDVALGRLVETPAEMVKSIDPYLANQRLAASSALVAGYDFLSDGSLAVDTALGSVIAAGSRTTRIDDTWTRSDIESLLYPSGASPFVVALNAHFDHYQALPAAGNTTGDRSDLLTTAAVVSRPNRLQGRLVFSIGCHSGLNVPDGYLGANAGQRATDWAQAMVNDGAVFIGNTGFGYGDKVTVAFSERLQALFARRLDGRYTAGAALTSAKQEYFASLAAYSDYDHKALMELTFYGLPFFGYGPNNGAPVVPAKVTTTTDPQTAGIPAAPVTFGPTFQTNTAPTGESYLIADGQFPQVVEGQPIQPRIDTDVTSSDPTLVAHGALITSLASSDTTGFEVAFARPVVDLAANEPAKPVADVAFPSRLQNVASYTAPDGPRQRLSVIPAQFVGDPATPGVGLQRRFTSIGAKVLYAPRTVTDFVAPTFGNVTAVANGSAAQFTVGVTDANSVVRVLVLYKDGPTWRSADLNPTGPGTWAGSGPSTAPAADYFVQAVDRHGNVAVSSDKATLFQTTTGTTNFAPTVLAGPDRTAATGAAVTISGSIVDPDSTSWTGTFTSGTVGSTPTPLTISGSTFTASASYPTAGSYTATIQICDSGNRCATDTVVVTVSTPVFQVAADMGVNGLQSIGFEPVRILPFVNAHLAVLTGSFSDAPAGSKAVSVRWANGGSFVPAIAVKGNRFLAANLYASAGTRVATVRVCVGTNCVTDDVTVVTGVPLGSLRPILECVNDRGAATNPRYAGRYGVQNDAAVPVYAPNLNDLTASWLTGVSIPSSISTVLQLLTDNRFSPTPSYRGQPQVIQPARQTPSFEVPFASGTMTWTLNGRTAVASTSSARCS